MKRKIAKLIAPRKFEITEEEIQPLKENEVLTRLISCGLCHSDIPAYQGVRDMVARKDGSYSMETNLKFPRLIGHEPVGIVVDRGSKNSPFKEGDIVGGPLRGALASCVTFNTLKNAFVKIPQNIKNVKHCLVEPLGCCANIVRSANPELGDYVAVIGCGVMGLLSISALARSGAFEVIAIDLIDSRLALAKELGATTTLNPAQNDPVEAVKNATGGRGADVVIEISGQMAGFSLACKIVRDNRKTFSLLKGEAGRAKILIPSLYAKPEIMDAGYDLMFKAPIIHSTHPWYSMNFFEDLERGIGCYARGFFPMDKLVTHEFSLEEVERGFGLMEQAEDGYIKGSVVF